MIALSFAVRCWDYLGGKDTFAKPEFTQRQQNYARYNRRPNIAAPQVSTNGGTTIVGDNRRQLKAAIAASDADGPAISIAGEKR